MSAPRIGALRHRLVLERLERAADGGGGAAETWLTEAALWAAIRPLGGHERMAADKVAGRLSHEITIRFRTGVTPEMRFRADTRIFHIDAVMDVRERRAWLRCLCTEDDL